MYTNRFRGFTLIELLVVIAIIGILSAVVLASLNTARNKGSDAAIQSNLNGIQTEAELYYSGSDGNTGTNTYASMCTADPTIVNALNGAKSANGGTAPACNATATAYAVQSPLVATSGTYWCVDSTGVSVKGTVALGTATACP